MTSPPDPLDLKPCFFCGETLVMAESLTWKGYFLHCRRCVRTVDINPEKYNAAYCWKLLAEKDSEIASLRQEIEEMSLPEYLHLNCKIKIQEQASRIKELEKLVAEGLQWTLEPLEEEAYWSPEFKDYVNRARQTLDRVRGK